MLKYSKYLLFTRNRVNIGYSECELFYFRGNIVPILQILLLKMCTLYDTDS